jgi:glycosyl transferase family 25
MTGALPIYVINLDHSANRLAYQRRQFERMGMQFERVQAIDGLALSREDFEKYAFLGDRPISHSEVACLLSHSLCWKKAAEGNGAVIMEDDQILADEIKPMLAALRPREGAVIINLETQPRPRYVSPESHETIAGVRLFELLLPTAGAGAYVVTREAAKILLERLDRKATIADYFIHSAPGIRRYQADPGLTEELRSLSGQHGKIIRPEAQTVISRSTHGRNLAIRMYWTVKHPRTRIRRAISQIGLVFKKARLPSGTVRRRIEPSPSILANLEAMDALDKQKKAANG